jgi:hypothetical protein
MQSPLHTPGPWRSHGAGGEIHGNSRIVATMCWCSGMHDEDEANARLVAAAPDMLAALVELTTEITQTPALMDSVSLAIFERACEAISKAEGQ